MRFAPYIPSQINPKGEDTVCGSAGEGIGSEIWNSQVFQPKTLRTGDAVSNLAALRPDVIIVVAYGKILPLEVLELPRLGCINVHGSLLPKYRGAAPIQWAVLNGEKCSGVTTMFMGEGVDTGDILLQEQVLLDEEETAGELFDAEGDRGAAFAEDNEAIGRGNSHTNSTEGRRCHLGAHALQGFGLS